jgi:hypothetical protein
MKDPAYWKALMLEASRIDYGEPLPQITEEFLTVWASHYARIASMTSPRPSLLEIGAGYGVLAAGLAQVAGGSVWATEHPSRRYLSSPSFREFLSAHGARLVANDLKEGLPFGAGKVRQVFCCDVTEHLTADQMVGQPFMVEGLFYRDIGLWPYPLFYFRDRGGRQTHFLKGGKAH